MRHYTITTEDVGRAHIRAFDQMWPVQDFLGRILPGDVGKRVYKRAGVLQVESQEQLVARMAAVARPGFDDDVAWLKFMANWERRDGWLHTPDRDKRMMRIGFDWAMKYPTMTTPSATDTEAHTDTDTEAPHCQCVDLGCSEAAVMGGYMRPDEPCNQPATMHLFRVTSMVHETPTHDNVPTDFCEPCGDKALESGAYCVGDDLSEPNHGPGCIERMYADHSDVNKEGGQSCDSRCREWPMTPCPIHEGEEGQS